MSEQSLPMMRINSVLFTIVFFGLTFVFAVICAVLALIPGRKPMMSGLWVYTKIIRFLMEVMLDIHVEVRGKDKLPQNEAFIIAAKHQSYGDGIIMFSEFFDLSFVTGDHLEKFTLLKTILRKAGAVVVDSCGGPDVHEKMTREAERVKRERRRLLIYPEGHLSQIGTQHRYRKGVYHMYKDFGCPVVPAATNLGQRWNQSDWRKYPGQAAIRFLDPIPPGLDKDAFMARLETEIETHSRAMLDMDNLGALNPADIGKTVENDVARAKREAREAQASHIDGSIVLNRGAKS
ncbi:lysophospholipid acyltransferase family protein [Robiginitomaculum antarcticum]|uniref:lysophospholipid acyltransferase family protein n=1 Tax=Robiginitomaculum antarcticum TaxID=437507 RepID=UPI000379C55D|nr:1-acyl-sn-glycerol-3-phosphate acyltransferase [Robiginitomaculum antarcticum]